MRFGVFVFKDEVKGYLGDFCFCYFQDDFQEGVLDERV